ncbi:MAG: ABC transporter permease, partial [Blastocatellia bacterium]|nr:ABC transporter permease [Blastocatellia bacterium]
GATTTMFSVVYNVLISPFPYKDPARIEDLLIRDLENPGARERGEITVPEFLDYQEQSTVFEEVVGCRTDSVIYTSNDGSEPFSVTRVTPNTFHFLGVAPILGRPITPDDGKPGTQPVAVMSYKFWINRFGGQADVLGRTLILDGVSYTIIGVMPPRFTWNDGDAWVPSQLERSDPKAATAIRYFQARLKPGVSEEQATAELNMIAHRIAESNPQNFPKRFTVVLKTTVDWVVGRFRGILYTLMAAVSVLLLIACCNTANMLLARATAREKEISIRLALGAGQRRIIRQLLTESLLLALLGASVGCLFAYGSIKILPYITPQAGIASEVAIVLNIPVLLFSLGAAFLTALLFGLAPGFHALRRNVIHGLRDSGKGAAGGSRHGRLRNALVVAEVALSLVLLFGGTALIRSFVSFIRTDLGIHTENLVLIDLMFPVNQYKTATEEQGFFNQVAPRLAAQPGVSSVAIANGLPPFGGPASEIEIPGKPQVDKSNVLVRLCEDGYFQTIGLRLLSGRTLSEADIVNSRRVAVINQTLALRYFGNEDPLGKAVALPSLAKDSDLVTNPVFEIVGVVSDAKNRGIQEPIQPEVILPLTLSGRGGRLIIVRSSIEPTLIVPAIRKEIRAVDRGVAIYPIIMDDWLSKYLFAQRRFSLILLSTFAGLGLLMVSVGVYSVMNYAVTLRSHEIGIRMALGAASRNIM